MNSADRKELMGYLRGREGMSKAAALAELRTCTPESLQRSLEGHRRKSILEAQSAASESKKKPSGAPSSTAKAKKVPYTLLLPPEQLEALRALSERDDSSVSHHIRQAIRTYLRGVRL
jgi:hypothetical protein